MANELDEKIIKLIKLKENFTIKVTKNLREEIPKAKEDLIKYIEKL